MHVKSSKKTNGKVLKFGCWRPFRRCHHEARHCIGASWRLKNEHHREHLDREMIEFLDKNTGIKTAKEGDFDVGNDCCLCVTSVV